MAKAAVAMVFQSLYFTTISIKIKIATVRHIYEKKYHFRCFLSSPPGPSLYIILITTVSHAVIIKCPERRLNPLASHIN